VLRRAALLAGQTQTLVTSSQPPPLAVREDSMAGGACTVIKALINHSARTWKRRPANKRPAGRPAQEVGLQSRVA